MKSLDNDILTSLAMLRRQTNPLQSPLYRFPSEVFSEIASHLQSKTDLVNLTHVSYHLRTALLSHPRLWSHIDSNHEERAREFIERSARAPLRVNLVNHGSQNLSLLHSHRARIVSLEMCDCVAQKKHIFSEPMPTLRRLKIIGCDHDDEDGDNDGEPDLGPGGNPILSLPSVTLLIVHCVGSVLLHVPHLTHFKFRETQRSTTRIDPLLEFLDNCPLLEDIDISYWSESPCSRDQLVSLPNLRTYRQAIRCGHYTLKLLNMLSLPPSCSVTSRCFSQPSSVGAAGTLPPFRHPDYLAGITRIKLRTTLDTSRGRITGTLELINAKGAKVRSERTVYVPPAEGDIRDELGLELMRGLQGLDARSAEILCLEGYSLWDGKGQSVSIVADVLGYLQAAATLILSGTTVKPCLLALDLDPNAGGHLRRFPPVHTLIIHSDFQGTGDGPDTLQILLVIAQRRKAAGFPLRSVSLFLLAGPGSEQILEELRGCVERFEVAVGDGVLGWDVDRYFLDGLGHLRECRDVRWD